MLRVIDSQLVEWKNQPGRKPLLLRGARQVGKSFAVENFGKKQFDSMVIANFEFERKYKQCFNTLDPMTIISNISAIAQQEIKPNETLLFLDEIQECPEAILALRYFKEKMPELHLIAAGSLLEFTLNDSQFRMPVGRVQSLYVKPCSFQEFLCAVGDARLCEQLAIATPATGVSPVIHELLLEKLREYFLIGGMPEVVSYYAEHKNLHLCHQLQASILEFYQRDFGKYAQKISIEYLHAIFDKIPQIAAKNFRYVEIDPKTQSRNIKPALKALVDAGLIYQVYQTSASGLPLSATINDRKFKLLFVDLGLLNHAGKLDIHTLAQDNLILLNRGTLGEQFVGQELLAYSISYEEAHLYYWEREKKSSTAEIDFVINVGSEIYPVEVKAGATGRLKSLQLFIDEKKSKIGVRISQNQLSFNGRILTVPLYMIHELPRLIQA